jgi:hypothetical protein
VQTQPLGQLWVPLITSQTPVQKGMRTTPHCCGVPPPPQVEIPPQTWQGCPPPPQAALEMPSWQTPWASQQPFGQLAGVQAHRPAAVHASPFGQAPARGPQFTVAPQLLVAVPHSRPVQARPSSVQPQTPAMPPPPQVWGAAQPPQSMVPPHPSGCCPHCPGWHSAGMQQAPLASQTAVSDVQQAAPQAMPLAQQSPVLPPPPRVTQEPAQQSVPLSQTPPSATQPPWQTLPTQTPLQQSSSPRQGPVAPCLQEPFGQSTREQPLPQVPDGQIHCPSRQTWGAGQAEPQLTVAPQLLIAVPQTAVPQARPSSVQPQTPACPPPPQVSPGPSQASPQAAQSVFVPSDVQPRPAQQTWPAAQPPAWLSGIGARKQPVAGSHEAREQVSPPRQVIGLDWHRPCWQLLVEQASPAQLTPQPPQLAGSLLGSTQAPPQRISFFPHGQPSGPGGLPVSLQTHPVFFLRTWSGGQVWSGALCPSPAASSPAASPASPARTLRRVPRAARRRAKSSKRSWSTARLP